MPRQVEATKLLLEGATPEQIDRVHVEFGMPMGPFQMADLAGVDIGWHRDPSRIESIRDALAAENRGARRPRPASTTMTTSVAVEQSARRGDHRRLPPPVGRHAPDDQRRGDRCAYPLHHGERGRADPGGGQGATRVDIDVVWIYGYGWPVYRGGPMFWAQSEGLDTVVDGWSATASPSRPR